MSGADYPHDAIRLPRMFTSMFRQLALMWETATGGYDFHLCAD